jgi:leucyl aminopeptidase
MDFELKTLTAARLCTEKCDALIVLVAQSSTTLAQADDVISKIAASAVAAGDLETKPGKYLSGYRVAGLAATRLVLVGTGDGSAKSVRTAVAAALGTLKSSNVKRVVLSLAEPQVATDQVIRTVVTACSDAAYNYTTTKSKSTLPSAPKFEQFVIAVPTAAHAAKAAAAFDKGVALSHGIGLAKEWANRPANHATPTLLAEAAKKLGKLPNIKVDVLGPKEVAKLGMGSFMAVAQGSSEPLRFIAMHYSGAAKDQAPIVLVGKGITFDTGGISIKPASEMDEMKFDMCGAASVLGVFRTLADLQPAINVVGLIPACENMPDGLAIKPSDVVTSMSGQTIEILNTDAEGRLVLCDALTYAERFKPSAVIDIATLTGACVVALGGVRSGLFASDDALAKALQDAGESAGDLCWRMPLDDEYAEGLKTNFADVANVAGRAGGAVTAAKFLQRFTTKFAWAHLDIAGTAWKSGAAKGATGRPVALLVDYLLGQAAASVPISAAPGKTPTRRTRRT